MVKRGKSHERVGEQEQMLFNIALVKQQRQNQDQEEGSSLSAAGKKVTRGFL